MYFCQGQKVKKPFLQIVCVFVIVFVAVFCFQMCQAQETPCSLICADFCSRCEDGCGSTDESSLWGDCLTGRMGEDWWNMSVRIELSSSNQLETCSATCSSLNPPIEEQCFDSRVCCPVPYADKCWSRKTEQRISGPSCEFVGLPKYCTCNHNIWGEICGGSGTAEICEVAGCQDRGMPLTDSVGCSTSLSCGVNRAYYGSYIPGAGWPDQPGSCATYPALESCVCCGSENSVSCSLDVSPFIGQTPLAASFTLSGFGPVTQWQLIYGDGSQSCSPSPCAGNPNALIRNHTYNLPSLYSAALTVWNSLGVSSVCNAQLTALQAPQNLRHTANSTSSIDWAWDASPGAEFYQIFLASYNILNPLQKLASAYFSYGNTNATTWHQTQTYIGGLINFASSNVQWNLPAEITVKSCRNGFCTTGATAQANTSIEKANQISCSNITNSSITASVTSLERIDNYTTKFSYLNQVNSGVRVKIQRQSDGSGLQNSPWLTGSGGVWSVPAPYTFSGLLANTSYLVCAQGRNQTGSSSGAGDYRPGPNSTDWFCVNCVTIGVSEPVSLGYLKLYHQAIGTIKLNLIHMNDALAKSPFPGTVKVARFNGDINSAADLVPVSDLNASPVRVYTGLTGAGSPNGIWSWKKLP